MNTINRPSQTRAGASAVNLAIVANDLEHVKEDVSDIKEVLSTMSNNLLGIARIEERQIAVVAAIEKGDGVHQDHEKRISEVEVKIPQLEEMRAWVIRGVSAGFGMLAVGILTLVIGVFADRYIPKQYVQALVVNPNAQPPAANPH